MVCATELNQDLTVRFSSLRLLWIILLIALIGINVLLGDVLPSRLQEIVFVALIVVLAVSVIASLLIDRRHLPIEGLTKHLEEVEKSIESDSRD